LRSIFGEIKTEINIWPLSYHQTARPARTVGHLSLCCPLSGSRAT